MRNIAILLAGIILGLIAGILIYPSLNSNSKNDNLSSENDNPEKVELDEINEQRRPGIMSNKAIGIDLATAWRFFDHYHGISDQTTIKDQFKTTIFNQGVPAGERVIESIFLEYEGFLEVIKGRVVGRGKEFLGLAGIPAYNPDIRSHTMIWLPVIKGANNDTLYFIPQDTPKEFIFDYVYVCPSICPVNQCDLWKEEWNPNETPSSQCIPVN